MLSESWRSLVYKSGAMIVPTTINNHRLQNPISELQTVLIYSLYLDSFLQHVDFDIDC